MKSPSKAPWLVGGIQIPSPSTRLLEEPRTDGVDPSRLVEPPQWVSSGHPDINTPHVPRPASQKAASEEVEGVQVFSLAALGISM